MRPYAEVFDISSLNVSGDFTSGVQDPRIVPTLERRNLDLRIGPHLHHLLAGPECCVPIGAGADYAAIVDHLAESDWYPAFIHHSQDNTSEAIGLPLPSESWIVDDKGCK